MHKLDLQLLNLSMANPVSLKISKTWFEQKWERSCFFGSPDIPTMYLRFVEDDEFFLAQFNLVELSKVYNSVLLPSKGMLYFFIRLSDFKPIVRYYGKNGYDEDKTARVDFNDNLNTNFNLTKEYKVKFIRTHKRLSSFMLDEETKYPEMLPNEIILLQYDQKNCSKILEVDGLIVFVIDKDELLQRNYEAVRMIIVR